MLKALGGGSDCVHFGPGPCNGERDAKEHQGAGP